MRAHQAESAGDLLPTTLPQTCREQLGELGHGRERVLGCSPGRGWLVVQFDHPRRKCGRLVLDSGLAVRRRDIGIGGRQQRSQLGERGQSGRDELGTQCSQLPVPHFEGELDFLGEAARTASGK